MSLEALEYTQGSLEFSESFEPVPPLKGQLLKWVGNKQRHAPFIIPFFPASFGTYYEPFLGAGGVLATLAPQRAVASDVFKPLVEIWQALSKDPERLVGWYRSRWETIADLGKKEAYERVLASYNASPNGEDFVFLTRVCYGGVVRFRKKDGYMSTPCGPHNPMHPDDFASRATIWHKRTRNTVFKLADYAETMAQAKAGDLCYLDPPYAHSQTILYGAQDFSLKRMFDVIADCKKRGVYVALSIDGTKRSGDVECDIPYPEGLFEREVFVKLGTSQLKRFQLDGQTAEDHHVTDRLLLTY
jgi:DNA adenine methylase